MAVDPYHTCVGIKMKQKELTKTFIMISNWKNPFGFYGLYKNMSALKNHINLTLKFTFGLEFTKVSKLFKPTLIGF